MDFDDCDYQVQQVKPRTRGEKVEAVDRDTVEKRRLAQRVEHFERFNPHNNYIKPDPINTTYSIDDVDRFNRDYTVDQKRSKEYEKQMVQLRAQNRRKQQEDYQAAIELRRQEEELEAQKVDNHLAQHDFNVESVNYDPVTCIVPDQTTIRGKTQHAEDADKEFRREARARRIAHNQNSTQYDPITGQPRNFW